MATYYFLYKQHAHVSLKWNKANSHRLTLLHSLQRIWLGKKFFQTFICLLNMLHHFCQVLFIFDCCDECSVHVSAQLQDVLSSRPCRVRIASSWRCCQPNHLFHSKIHTPMSVECRYYMSKIVTLLWCVRIG